MDIHVHICHLTEYGVTQYIGIWARMFYEVHQGLSLSGNICLSTNHL